MRSYFTRDNVIVSAFAVMVLVGCYGVTFYRIAHQH